MAHQPPLSIEFSRQEYWIGLRCLPPGDLPDPGIEPESLVSPALAVGFFTTAPPGKPLDHFHFRIPLDFPGLRTAAGMMELEAQLLGNIMI